MEECIVEDGPPGLMEVEHLPLVDQLLIAEGPPEDVLTQSQKYQQEADEKRVDSEEQKADFLITCCHVILCVES